LSRCLRWNPPSRGGILGRWSRPEYLRAIDNRYRRSSPPEKGRILDAFCRVCGYNRKYALRLLRGPRPAARARPRARRRPLYGPEGVEILARVWEAAGDPWSVRLQARLPLWLPWIQKRFSLSPAVEGQLLAIRPRPIDRRLPSRKRRPRRRLDGRTKPGTLLKHPVPIQTNHGDVPSPGYPEIDLVSHSGECAAGEFLHALHVTDIHSTWTETRAVLGKGETGIVAALEQMRRARPFPLRGIDSDNGSEFLHHQRVRDCERPRLPFTRGRPYQKDDNAPIEQKNWTHARKRVGGDRYDTPAAQEFLNGLDANELRLRMHLFQPAVKRVSKKRAGSRVRRIYDAPQTPLDRLCASPGADKKPLRKLLELRQSLDPFALAATLEDQLDPLAALATLPQQERRVTSQTA